MPAEVQVALVKLPGAEDLPLPAYATAGSAGLDLRAAVEAPLKLAVGERRAVPTGLSLAIPAGYEAQIRPRSGLALEFGIVLPNAPGTIDADFRGELMVILANMGSKTFEIRRGDRIAQLVLAPVARLRWKEVATLPTTERGAGGFGSTGQS